MPQYHRLTSTIPTIEVHPPPEPPIQNLAEVPRNGPIPAFQLPPTENRRQLLQQLQRFAIQLEVECLKDESAERVCRPQAGRPTHQPNEFLEFRQILMGPWSPGPCYGPVFAPQIAKILFTHVKINRYLVPPSSTAGLRWDVTQPVTSAKFVKDGETLEFKDFYKEPATSPRIPHIKVVIGVPWPLRTIRTGRPAGVTVGDVLSDISEALFMDYNVRGLSEANRAVLFRAHQERCPDKSEAQKPLDLLDGLTAFGGLIYDREREEEFLDRKWEIYCFVKI